MVYKLHNINETQQFAQNLAKQCKAGDVLALIGNLGSGKTTLTQFLVKSLNSDDKVQSPTFVIHRQYKVDYNNIKKVNHIDLYRIQSQSEVENLDILEMISEPNSITIIEWPEILLPQLPKNTKVIKFELRDNEERVLNVT